MSRKSKIKIGIVTGIIGVVLVSWLYNQEMTRIREGRIYLEKVTNIISAAKEIRDESTGLFESYSSAEDYESRGLSESYLYSKFTGYASIFEYLLGKGQQLEPPEEYHVSHTHLISYLELSASGFDLLVEAIRASDIVLLEKTRNYLLDAEEAYADFFSALD